MGSATFITYAEGADVEVAFREAVDQAQHDHGHGGYTGTIANKDSYIVIDGVPRTEADAEALITS
ncbi:MAG TPA: hypothetical protein VFG15_07070 [Amycolatopsis sp.]|nr:hypothetical protein [Amycolatopsis sp.]